MTRLDTAAAFDVEALVLDAEEATRQITDAVRRQVLQQLRRKGAVVGISGGIDSSVAAALCVRALGADRVLGLFMPERDSSPDSLILGRLLADHLGVRTELEDVTAVLEAVGCYRRRDEAVRSNERIYVTADGRRYDKSLTRTCLGCHQNKANSCDRCHDYLDVKPYCWECHVDPKGGL